MPDLPSKIVNKEKPAQPHARRTRDLNELERQKETERERERERERKRENDDF